MIYYQKSLNPLILLSHHVQDDGFFLMMLIYFKFFQILEMDQNSLNLFQKNCLNHQVCF